jgi:hypothetical protein
VANNTWVSWVDPAQIAIDELQAVGPIVGLTFHNTMLFMCAANGFAVVDMGYWWTTTTLRRLNRLTPFQFYSLQGYHIVELTGKRYVCPSDTFWVSANPRRLPRQCDGRKLVSWASQQAAMARVRAAVKMRAKRQRQRLTRARQYIRWIHANRLLSRKLHPALDAIYVAGAADAGVADTRIALQVALEELTALRQRLLQSGMDHRLPGRSRLLELPRGQASMLVPINIYEQ